MEVELDDVKIPPKTPTWGSEVLRSDQGFRSWGLIFALSVLNGVSSVEQATERKVWKLSSPSYRGQKNCV